jgi:hypothetical protein
MRVLLLATLSVIASEEVTIKNINDEITWIGKKLRLDVEQYNYQLANGCDFSGVDGLETRGAVVVIDVMSCAATCAVNGLCNYFSYDTNSSVCFFHSSEKEGESEVNLTLLPEPNNFRRCGYITSADI